VGTALEKVAPPGQLADELSIELRALDETLNDTLAPSLAPATTKVYTRNWRRFEEWADAYGLVSLPATPQTVARYLTDLAKDHAPATLTQHVSAIAGAHKAAGYADPPTRSLLVHKTLAGLRRQQGTAPSGRRSRSVSNPDGTAA
jgi:hypothetical protein